MWQKSTLCSSKDRLLWPTRFAKKFFTKRSRIRANHSLHTIRISHEFHPLGHFHYCSKLACSGLNPQNFLPSNEWYSGPNTYTTVLHNSPVYPTAWLEFLSFISFFFFFFFFFHTLYKLWFPYFWTIQYKCSKRTLEIFFGSCMNIIEFSLYFFKFALFLNLQAGPQNFLEIFG